MGNERDGKVTADQRTNKKEEIKKTKNEKKESKVKTGKGWWVRSASKGNERSMIISSGKKSFW